MSAPDTGYHAPIDIDAPASLAAARERRARKQRPYPAMFELPTAAEIAEADERHAIARGNRWARSLVLLTFVLVLVALGLSMYFR